MDRIEPYGYWIHMKEFKELLPKIEEKFAEDYLKKVAFYLSREKTGRKTSYCNTIKSIKKKYLEEDYWVYVPISMARRLGLID